MVFQRRLPGVVLTLANLLVSSSSSTDSPLPDCSSPFRHLLPR